MPTAYEPASTSVSTGRRLSEAPGVLLNLTANATNSSAPPPPPLNRNPYTTGVTTLVDDRGPSEGLQEVSAIEYVYGWPGGAVLLLDSRRSRLYRLSLTETATTTATAGGRRLGERAESAEARLGANSFADGVESGGAEGAVLGGRRLSEVPVPVPAANSSAVVMPALPPTPPAPPYAPGCSPGELALLAAASSNSSNGAASNVSAAPGLNASSIGANSSLCDASGSAGAGGNSSNSSSSGGPSSLEERILSANTVCAQGVAAAEGEVCHPTLRLLAGSTPGLLDGMGVRTRFYRPRGLAVDPTTRSVFVADSYNHRVRLLGLEDVLTAEEADEEAPMELLGRALRQNFIFILWMVSGSLGLACLTYTCCRFCSFCPLYQRKLHEKRMRAMNMGSRV